MISRGKICIGIVLLAALFGGLGVGIFYLNHQCTIEVMSAKQVDQNDLFAYALPATVMKYEQTAVSELPSHEIHWERGGRVNVISLESFDLIDSCSIDLNGDGVEEWIIKLPHEQGAIKDVYILAVRDEKLAVILMTDEYFTIIPKEGTYPDIESWKGIPSTLYTRIRQSYDADKKRYKWLWSEFYNKGVLTETVLYH